MAAPRWLGLRCSVPAEPSRSRVYVWRHLRALGAQTAASGVAVLPDTPDNAAKFEHLAAYVRRSGGEALLIRFDFVSAQDEKELLARFEHAAAQEKNDVAKRCAEIVRRIGTEGGDSPALRELKSLLRRYGKSPLRHFSPRTDNSLADAAGEIFGTLRSLPAEVRSLLSDAPAVQEENADSDPEE